MRRQKQPVKLSDQERLELEAIVKQGQQEARLIQRAQMVLWSDEGKMDTEIAALLGLTPVTVAKIRERWVKRHTLEDVHRVGRGGTKFGSKR